MYNYDKNKKVVRNLWILIAVSTLLILSWGTTRVILSYQFDKNAGGHLKRAANANTVEMAKTELEVALNYIESNNLTSGSTYVFFDTPDKDIGYWYKNLKDANEELSKVTKDSTQLETTNLLMKLRETLTETNSDGATAVTVPPGISVYPNNALFLLWGWIGFIVLLISSGYLFYREVVKY